MNPLLARLTSFTVGHFVVAGIFLAAGIHFMKLSSHSEAKERLDSQQAQIVQLQEQLRTGQTLSQEQPRYEKEIADTKQTLEIATELIPTPHSQREIIALLTEKSRAAGVRLPVLKPGSPFPKNGAVYSSLTYDLEIEGEYTQIANFFFELSKAKNILHVQDLIMAKKDRAEGKAILTCKAILLTFVYTKKLAGATGTEEVVQ